MAPKLKSVSTKQMNTFYNTDHEVNDGKRKRDDSAKHKPAKRHHCENLMNNSDSEILQDMGLALLGDESSDESVTESSSKNTRDLLSVSYLSVLGPKCPLNSQKGEKFCLGRRKKKAEDSDYFSNIADEVILQIFKWLPKTILARCSMVCHRWKRLAFDESLWKRLDLGNKFLKPGIVGQLIRRGVTVFRLNRASIGEPVFENPSLAKDKTNQRFSMLQYLDLTMASISTEGLYELLSVCGRLRKLSLEHCTINDKVCNHISANVDLECLNLCMCKGISSDGIVEIEKNCIKLESLNISWMDLEIKELMAMARHLPESIRHLNVAGYRNVITNEVVTEIAQRCPRMVNLDLSDSALLTGDIVPIIVKSFPIIQHLALSRCYNINPNCYISLGNMSSLQILEIFGLLSDSSIQSLRQSFPQLEINKTHFSHIARPTTGIRRTSIWGLRVRD